MNEFLKEALEKIDKGMKEKLDRYGDAMKADVGAALKDFCHQDAEFAQAVAQGGSFADCMRAVAKGVKGNSISDMKAFGLAVEFYFPGAGIEVTMNIDLCASVKDAAGASPRPTASDGGKGVVIDLSDFFN